MNTLYFEENLAKKWAYKKLPVEESKKVRQYYTENIPEFLDVNGGKRLYTSDGTLICDSYERIVIGDYGAFIEFTVPAARFIIAPGQEYRIYDEKYANTVKYEWYTMRDKSNIKIYKQKRGVTYADYKPGKYYVSVHQVFEKGK